MRLRDGFFCVVESVMGKGKKGPIAYLTGHKKFAYVINIRDLKPVDV